MRSYIKLIFIYLFFLSSDAFSNSSHDIKYIELTGNINLRSSANFSSSANNIVNVLNAGNKVQVIGYNLSLTSGIGIKVRVVDPKSSPLQEGWIYYSTRTEQNELFKLYNNNNRRMLIDYSYVRNYFARQNSRLRSGKIKLPNLSSTDFASSTLAPEAPPSPDDNDDNEGGSSSQSQNETDDSDQAPPRQSVYKPTRISDISNNQLTTSSRISLPAGTKAFFAPANENFIYPVTLVPGSYKIDHENINDAGVIPIKHTVIHNGESITTTLWITKDGTNFNPQSVQANTYAPIQTAECAHCKDDEDNGNALLEDASGLRWHQGCQVLAKPVLSNADQTNLQTCHASISRDLITKAGRPFNRERLLTHMYRSLNPFERDYYAMMLTTLGEVSDLGRGSPQRGRQDIPLRNEMLMVMKVLENRARYARQRTSNPNIGIIDVALQPKQFSMYNETPEHQANLERAFLRVPRSIVNATVNAYLKLKVPPPPVITAKSSNGAESPERIYHYHLEGAYDNRVVIKNYDLLESANRKRRRDGKPKVEWYQIGTERPNTITIDGTPMASGGSRHLFYESVRWSYKGNDFQP